MEYTRRGNIKKFNQRLIQSDCVFDFFILNFPILMKLILYFYVALVAYFSNSRQYKCAPIKTECIDKENCVHLLLLLYCIN